MQPKFACKHFCFSSHPPALPFGLRVIFPNRERPEETFKGENNMHGPVTQVGGKNRLAKTIIALFPEHKCFVEPFAGGAQVFFHKPISRVEVLNDLDGELINFFRVCQAHAEELVRCLRYHLASRRWFELLKKTDPAMLTDIQRAVRFFYIRKTSFGGRVLKPTFGYGVTGRARFQPSRIPSIIAMAHQRLQDVQIECLSYQKILKKYDGSETLFYLDPPYWDLPYYNHNFTETDFVEFAALLSGLKGKFILSLNDTPEVRKLFRAFRITSVELSYSCARHSRRRRSELLITNFTPKTLNSPSWRDQC
jgi:DNA adenine methylase